MIAYSKKKQRKGQSDDDYIQRDAKEKRMKNMVPPKFRNSFLDLAVNHATLCHRKFEISFSPMFPLIIIGYLKMHLAGTVRLPGSYVRPIPTTARTFQECNQIMSPDT